MSVKPRRSVLGRSNDQVLIYAALFLACALLSALGVGVLSVLAFIPAAIAVACLQRVGPKRSESRRYQQQM
jgi:hypothetical protein